jgi:nicotinamidase-related amidase
MKTACNKDLRRSPNSAKAPVALLLIDVINDLEFAEADDLLKRALPMAHRLEDLNCRAAEKGIPCIYVKDNFGHWKSDFLQTVRHCSRSRGGQIARLLAPSKASYLVLKPKHSGFYATTLDLLLEYLGTKILIITGITADICVLFTANDAYMRDYQLHVPADCVVSNTSRQEDYSLGQMSKCSRPRSSTQPLIDLDTMLMCRGDTRKSTTPGKLLALNGFRQWP